MDGGEMMGTELVLAGFELTRTGLIVEGEPTAKEWDQAADALSQVDGALQWWIGDLLLCGEDKPEWGETYKAACERFGREEQTLKNYKAVAKAVKLSRRRDNLSWKHHAEVASLPAREQTKWLKYAEKNELSAADLRRELRDSQSAEYIPPPAGSYDLIYADPPWRYDFAQSDSRKIENQYPTMEVEEMCDLEIPAALDCVLFLWATSPKLPASMRVLSACRMFSRRRR